MTEISFPQSSPSAGPPHRRRRHLAVAVTAAAAVAAGGSAPAAQAACPADDPCPSTLPAVNMSRVVLAATLDPWRTDLVKTYGASKSVRRVEAALHRRGLLAKQSVDGYFGTATVKAWGKFERNQKQTSRWTRNGLPGLAELQALGKGRFRLTNTISVGKKIKLASVANGGNSDDGNDVVNKRTQSMFLEAQKNMKSNGKKGWDMTIVQGGYCGAACADASAGTHNGGGTIDIRTWDTDSKGVSNRVAALKRVGFAAWYRPWGDNAHIHAVAINDYQMTWEIHGDGTAPDPIVGSYGGNCQVYEWKFNFDGLSGCDQRASSKTKNQKSIVTWEMYKARK
ncbi:peptidoglycan-binding protein [Paraconexibacter sp.]|uniref:peptidoglycan-binding domain-containing protein n=1 Tax=Paraconexibacter sp. TaxID=2949640 RepID=UPI003569EF44